ncbi:MAG: hypothetical protein HZB56_01415 [Deltaproteobacteria bacterium]|nr:hypothetical protein [Deltaproteobacteria bacterium]
MALTHELVLALDGVFDLVAAQRVQDALNLVRAGGVLAIDLTKVVEFQDLGVGALARTVRQSNHAVHIVLRGLRLHQVNLLRHLGVDGRPAAGAQAES